MKRAAIFIGLTCGYGVAPDDVAAQSLSVIPLQKAASAARSAATHFRYKARDFISACSQFYALGGPPFRSHPSFPNLGPIPR